MSSESKTPPTQGTPLVRWTCDGCGLILDRPRGYPGVPYCLTCGTDLVWIEDL
jgi:hypothetical protein